MSANEYIKLPRLYVDQDLSADTPVSFTADQAHYLKNVMRRQPGDRLRLFNGRSGEWLAALTTADKKQATARLEKQLLPQPPQGRETHLLFAPIKKARMDFLIEKAVELGATHLHPVITQYTEVRQVNEERLRAQIVEAAEQCERLSVPALAPAKKLATLVSGWDKAIPVHACIERAEDAPLLQDCALGERAAFLIGPEGGFAPEEIEMLRRIPAVRPVSLGSSIYRAETAALICLAAVRP